MKDYEEKFKAEQKRAKNLKGKGALWLVNNCKGQVWESDSLLLLPKYEKKTVSLLQLEMNNIK